MRPCRRRRARRNSDRWSAATVSPRPGRSDRAADRIWRRGATRRRRSYSLDAVALPCSTDSTTKRKNAPARRAIEIVARRHAFELGPTSSGPADCWSLRPSFWESQMNPSGVIDWTIVPQSQLCQGGPVCAAQYHVRSPWYATKRHRSQAAACRAEKIATLPPRRSPCRRSRSDKKREPCFSGHWA